MRYATKEDSNPEKGQTRTVSEFLLFPKCLKNSDNKMEYRWFETVSIEQIYEERGVEVSADPGYSSEVDWFDNKWID